MRKDISKADLIRQIKKHKDSIARHRDALRDILDDLESVSGSASDGVQKLESAIDTLSEYL